jgi:hypothetical protein
MPRKKKHPAEGKHPTELTTDEVLERVFSREVRDKLKEILGRGDKQGRDSPHQSVERSERL